MDKNPSIIIWTEKFRSAEQVNSTNVLSMQNPQSKDGENIYYEKKSSNFLYKNGLNLVH